MNLNQLIKDFNLESSGNDNSIKKVNAHIHTPYSFSMFTDVKQAVEMAEKEDVRILGINDFYTTDGYNDFYHTCLKHNVYPLFNIEFIGLIKEYQQKNIRVNDPSNPGRMYFTGKGLDYPFRLSPFFLKKLMKVQDDSNKHVKLMVDKANEFFANNDIPVHLDFDEIGANLAKKIVRERHIAKAIRLIISENIPLKNDRIELLKKIYSGKESKADVNDNTALENEIRSQLLKKGGPAFVPEDESIFLGIDDIIEIIINAGGIPCYPVLLDDASGTFTDFEKDWDFFHHELSKINVKCIELIPGRNSAEMLEKFVDHFNKLNYVILFGTEHNSPDFLPLTVSCRGNVPLSKEIQKISYEGACVVAAHQFLRSKIKEGYLMNDGQPKSDQKQQFVKFGNLVLKEFLK